MRIGTAKPILIIFVNDLHVLKYKFVIMQILNLLE